MALRHSFTSHLVAGATGVLTLQELTGHKPFSRLQPYPHLLSGKTWDAVELLDR